MRRGIRFLVAGIAAATVTTLVSGAAAEATQQSRVARAQASETLGPDGYKAVKLGMSEEEAVATGELIRRTDVPSTEYCGWYALKDWPGGPGAEGAGVVVSPTYGVVAIWAYPSVQTPEGIGLGSTVSEVKAAYPDYEEGEQYHGGRAPVPGGAEGSLYRFGRFDGDNGRITRMFLQAPRQDCYE
ncbi:hypothetical protein ACFWY9_00990 [Amycolatopsis sp. NPDC059027]|uniref:hypothetical protein n=1 Tax=unclassified Amycolatopsis TaxID=2618356 RepID=UPI00366DA507